MKKKMIVLIVILFIVLFILGYIIIKKSNKESVINIEGINFTLNDIKKTFMNSDYAKSNKCRLKVIDTGIEITCNKITNTYLLNGEELQFIGENVNLEAFKYLVNSIEYLHGYGEYEYLNTIERFIKGELNIAGLVYQTINNQDYLSVYFKEKLEKAKDLVLIKEEVIKDITDVNYEYAKDNYKITGISMNSDKEEYKYVFSGTLSGPDYNQKLTIKYYDEYENLLIQETINLNDYNNYNNKYLNFLKTTEFSESAFNRVKKYSISLS